LTTQGLCEDEGGTWFGPDGAAGADGLATCCDVNTTTGQNYTIDPDAQWAVRNDQYKLVMLEQPNCTTNQLDLRYEFYAIDDAAPTPALDRVDANLLPSPFLPAQGLDSTQLDAFNALSKKLDRMLASQPECTGDGNMDRRVDQTDLDDWSTFAGLGSSVYDLNLGGQTDDADTMVVRGNFGARCAVKRSPH
jgi:hypothetical protein